jgi:hypothetical protein
MEAELNSDRERHAGRCCERPTREGGRQRTVWKIGTTAKLGDLGRRACGGSWKRIAILIGKYYAIRMPAPIGATSVRGYAGRG